MRDIFEMSTHELTCLDWFIRGVGRLKKLKDCRESLFLIRRRVVHGNCQRVANFEVRIIHTLL